MKWLCKIGIHKWSKVHKIGFRRERYCMHCDQRQILVADYPSLKVTWKNF